MQTAMASRVVGVLEEMETMCAVPVGERCVSFGSDVEGGGEEEDVE